jgi:methylmalonyl-CoA epimerase
MTFKRIHHLAIVVRDLDAALKTYSDKLGLRLVQRRRLETGDVELASLKIGETYIELITPVGIESPIHRYLEEHGEGFFQMAIEVDDLGRRVAELKDQGVRFVDCQPTQFDDCRVALIDPACTHGVQVQLVEPVRGESPTAGFEIR